MDALADYFKVFSEPNRLTVLQTLRDGPLNVTAVVQRTGLSQALVSKHLKLLMIAGVVRRRPDCVLRPALLSQQNIGCKVSFIYI